MRELIGQRRSTLELIEHLHSKDVKTIQDCCLTKVLEGEVPIEEYIMINMGS
jgi:type II secretory ATPase GspE/PulE/Tfp pilus assembly ATPase PilB-like protein